MSVGWCQEIKLVNSRFFSLFKSTWHFKMIVSLTLLDILKIGGLIYNLKKWLCCWQTGSTKMGLDYTCLSCNVYIYRERRETERNLHVMYTNL